MKTCRLCRETKDLTDFSEARWTLKSGEVALYRRGECRACQRAAEKARDKSHRASTTAEYKRAERFRRVFGITLEDYDEMLATQGGVCAICGKGQSWNRREGNVLVVDHDHVTGAVRGLLCHPCNQTLGLMQDDPDRLLSAAAYLLSTVEVKQDAQADGNG